MTATIIDGVRHATFRDSAGRYVTVSRPATGDKHESCKKATVVVHLTAHNCLKLETRLHDEFIRKLRAH